MTYSFLVASSPDAIASPDTTLGIGVADSDVASACGLGNIDGLHNRGAWPRCQSDVPAVLRGGSATIDIATEIPLPPDGSTFATTEASLDSVGALAVLVLRRLGLPYTRGPDEERSYLRRVHAVAAAATWRRTDEWSPAPLPTLENPWPRTGPAKVRRDLAHLTNLRVPWSEQALPLNERVAVTACWLLWGMGPAGADRLAVADRIYLECGVGIGPRVCDVLEQAEARALGSRRDLAEDVRCGALVRLCGKGCAGRDHFPAVAVGAPCAWCGAGPEHSVAIVRSTHTDTIELGLCVSPVVVHIDTDGAVDMSGRKVTIAVWLERYLDPYEVRSELNELEDSARHSMLTSGHDGEGWTMAGATVKSPRNGTRLTEQQIVDAARATVRAG